MPSKVFFTALLSLLILSACQTSPAPVSGTNPTAPQHIRTANSDILLAHWANQSVVSSMDQADLAKNQQAEARAAIASVGQQITWKNSKNGDNGVITPTNDDYTSDGVYCRDFQQTVTINGQAQTGRIKACQQADGSWKVTQ